MCIQDLMVDISKMPSVIRNLRNGCELAAAVRFYVQDTYQRNAIEMVSTPGKFVSVFL